MNTPYAAEALKKIDPMVELLKSKLGAKKVCINPSPEQLSKAHEILNKTSGLPHWAESLTPEQGTIMGETQFADWLREIGLSEYAELLTEKTLSP